MIPGMLSGALLGLGACVLWSRTWPEQTLAPLTRRRRTRPERHVAEQFAVIGLGPWGISHLVAISVLWAIIVCISCFALSGAVIPSMAAGIAALIIPPTALGALARRRQHSMREVWPEVIDLVHSAVRAGLSLPEALTQLADRGPEIVQAPFREFGLDYQATGDFSLALDRLKVRLADPVADRVIEALRVTRDVGGTDLGTLLRTLSMFLREYARVRSELEARQSWTINGAKLALIAPWVVLGLMLLRPEAASAYDTPEGGALILAGAAISVIAYRVMKVLARLPQDERTLQ